MRTEVRPDDSSRSRCRITHQQERPIFQSLRYLLSYPADPLGGVFTVTLQTSADIRLASRYYGHEACADGDV